MLLTREHARILGNPEPITIEVNEWDCEVRIRQMTGEERLEYIAAIGNGEDPTNGIRAMVRLVQQTAVDAEGERIFPEDAFNDVASLPFPGLKAVAEAAATMNGLNVQVDEEKSVAIPS